VGGWQDGGMLPTLAQIRSAREAIAGIAIRTPLVRLPVPAGPDIYLKLENLQPIGSFKIRGAAALLTSVDPAALADGVVTASAGNMGQGAAWMAARLGVGCTVVVPSTAPAAKVDAIEAHGATVRRVTPQQWWQAFQDRRLDGLPGLFVHAFDDPMVMAGNATIGLEIAEDLPDVATVLVPWGGGGLTCGIATALADAAPRARVYAAEVETAAPFAASLAAGAPVTVANTPSFVDGIGGPAVFPGMFAHATELGVGSRVAKLDEVAAAVRLLVQRARVVAEGAGATPLACALADAARGDAGSPAGPVVCVVSGGMIELPTLVELLSRRPDPPAAAA
jgi:threonine dehydratase